MRSLLATILIIVLCVWAVELKAQHIVSGPVLGGVTEDGARIYYRTNVPADLLIEVSTNPDYSNAMSFEDETTAADYSVAIADISGLEPDTRYYYRVFVGGVEYDTISMFTTFPKADERGYYKVVFGSCNYENSRSGGGGSGSANFENDVLFQSILDFDPRFVLHLGDWNYPPSHFGANYNLNPLKRANSFSFRYDDYHFSRYILPYIPVDYMYDDSYSYNGAAGWTWPAISTDLLPNGDTKYVLMDIPMDPGIRTGNIEGYFDHFPGYDQVDTSGVHHSFKMGNVEFFIVDTRNSKDAVHAGFRYNELLNVYTWQPPPGHSTLGEIQKEWLLEELRNSDADWKVIGSSVLFNRKLFNLMDLVLLGQLFDRSLIEYAATIAYLWAGYPEDMFDLLDAVREDSIENVILLSGDTHSSMMDDGANSGIPEISSSGWAAGDEGYFNDVIDDILDQVGLPITTKDFLWNGGGTGVDNDYFGDSYVTLEFFYQDSMRSCVIDEFDQTLVCMTLLFQGEKDTSDITTAEQSYTYIPESTFRLLYPNPSRDQIRVEFNASFQTDDQSMIVLMNEAGKQYQQFTGIAGLDHLQFDISQLPTGIYLLQIINGDHMETRKFVKQR
ncbi:MAG: T9SS type A sorting domain-containing protein [Bacteroidetes bacterium]|nr:T9SS type A sorting domain-containing protein [Bacteroidota bacterium]